MNSGIGFVVQAMLSGEKTAGRPRRTATAAEHTHRRLVRHRHPGWHGHCDRRLRGYKPCDRPHWHFWWTHIHGRDSGRASVLLVGAVAYAVIAVVFGLVVSPAFFILLAVAAAMLPFYLYGSP